MPSRQEQSGDLGGQEPSVPPYTVWKELLTQLCRKELITKPPTFNLPGDIVRHLQEVERYLEITAIKSSNDQATILYNSLDEELRMEVGMAHGFKENGESFEWLKNVLLRMYSLKTSRAAPLTAMLEVRQGSRQPTAEYARHVRIHAYRNISQLDTATRESYMIHAFTRGLKNRQVATAVEFLQPETLDQAVQMVKQEEKKNSHEEVCLLNNAPADNAYRTEACGNVNGTGRISNVSAPSDTLKFLMEKIMFLEKEVGYLRRQFGNRTNTRTTGFTPHREKGQFGGQRPFRTPITCYNCSEKGHTSYNCTKPTKCYECKGNNHIARNCPRRRYIQNPKNNAVNELSYSEVASLSLSNRFEVFEDDGKEAGEVEEQVDESCLAVTDAVAKPKSRVCISSAYRGKVDPLCRQYANYIEGKAKKPEEVITRLDQASKMNNKPIVQARLESKVATILLDSGATCNLVSKQFFDEVQHYCKLLPSSRGIRCANSSPMRVLGQANMSVDVGGNQKVISFAVVDKLCHGDAILGIRSMKRMGIELDIKQSRAMIRGLSVPFVHEVRPCTTLPGNGHTLRL